MSSPAEPTRVAFCITELDPGGAERALVQLVSRLDRSCWEPSVICLSASGPLADELGNANVPVTCLGARSSRDLRVVGRLVRELRNCRPALLQTFLFHANIAGRIAGRLAGVPRIVAGIRVAEKRSRARLWIDRVTQRLVDHHVCVSQAVADFSIHHCRLPAEKVSVIPNGVDANRFAHATPADLSEFTIPAGSRTVLFVGRLDPQKGPFLLFEAIHGLLPVYGDLHVLLVGDGPLRNQLEAWVAAHQLVPRIHFAGWRADVAPLMKAADCLVLPSRWEGMPNVILEAMASGLPVVATDVEGTAELIENHKTGLVVPQNSPQQLAAALAALLGDPEQAQTMGFAAQDFFSQRFTWERHVQSFEQLYHSLLEN